MEENQNFEKENTDLNLSQQKPNTKPEKPITKNYKGEKVNIKKTPLHKLAKLLLVLSSIGLGYCMLGVVSLLLLLIFYMFVAIILILTLFTVNWFAEGAIFTQLLQTMLPTIPYVLYAVLGLSVISLLIYIFKKDQPKTAGIVMNSINIVLGLALLILSLNTTVNL